MTSAVGVPERIAGGATPEATRGYFASHPLPTPPSPFGRTGWTVSPVGFGTYRVDRDHAEHRAALQLALASGCNLIDTSANYGDGDAERLVGEVLAELIGGGHLRREELVVVTKAGYLQGENLEFARQRAREGHPIAETVKFAHDCWHCISPEFLEQQLTRSLDRLGLERVDVLLLHNPEYYLKAEGDHAEYYRRIRRAFEHLEKEVARGRIQYYGISSNTFPEPKEAPDYTSLEAVHELSREVSPDSRFGVIQFPLNLFEPGAALERNNNGKTVLEYALSAKLATMVNRPLNAFAGKRLVRLASFPRQDAETIENNLKASLEAALALESAYPGQDIIPLREIAWGHLLRQNLEQLLELQTWRQVLAYRITPQLARALPMLEAQERTREWAREYRTTSNALFGAMTGYLEALAAERAAVLTELLAKATPELTSSPTLSQKCVRIYRSLPGVSSVLVGMRKADYVADSLALQPPLSIKQALASLLAAQQADTRSSAFD